MAVLLVKNPKKNLAGSMILALEVLVVNLADSRTAGKNEGDSTDDLAISGGDLSNQRHSIFSKIKCSLCLKDNIARTEST